MGGSAQPTEASQAPYDDDDVGMDPGEDQPVGGAGNSSTPPAPPAYAPETPHDDTTTTPDDGRPLTEGVLLVDARNGFNELSRKAMLWTVRHLWLLPPPGDTRPTSSQW